MPLITDWFDDPKMMEWEKLSESLNDDRGGMDFYTYPLYWLLPYVHLKEADLVDAPQPLWIPDVSPDSEIGQIDNEGEGSYVIELAADFEEYLESLTASIKKKFRAVLRKNEDLVIHYDRQSDIDSLWQNYEQRLAILTRREGVAPYSASEMALRRLFYRSKEISVMGIYDGERLLATNVSYWKGDVVYDLACLISPDPEALRRSLGTYAILKNIELAIIKGMREYDLLTREYGYKRSYGAKERKLKRYISCSKEFARFYGIPLTAVDKII